MNKYIELAAKVSRLKDDNRTYYHGAVGIRKDGIIVCASNGNPKEPEPRHHAEARVLRKLGHGGELFVVRTTADGLLADSTPCIHCANAMAHKGVKLCTYSLSPGTTVSYRPYKDFGVKMIVGVDLYSWKAANC